MNGDIPSLSGPPNLVGPPSTPKDSVAAAKEDEGKPAVPTEYKSQLSWTSGRDGIAPVDSLYTICGKCKAVYVVTEDMIGEGTRIQCSVCNNVWFQAPERLKEMTEGTAFAAYDVEGWKRDEGILAKRRGGGGGGGSGGSSTLRGGKGAITLFVGNLPFSISEERLQEEFEHYGELTQVAIIKDADGRPRGFGFVDFQEEAAGQMACKEMNGFSLEGRYLDVKVSEDRRGGGGGGRGGGPGGRGGGRGGRGGGRGGGAPRGDGRGSDGKFSVVRRS
jgi:predicted Zn finger-like uncharacterized protein